MRNRQLAWALAGGIPREALEKRHGKLSWILEFEQRKRNLFRPSWWDYIKGFEHRWARALNSSQCFAVNLFAPLKESSDAGDSVPARKMLETLLPARSLSEQDSISVDFEFTPPGSAAWLGERGQATQIDVCFQIARSGRCYSYVLVEVKFSEASFGSCRGWKPKSDNPDPGRCLDVSAIMAPPHSKCWLVESEGRKYWDIMSRRKSTIQQDAISQVDGCPFRFGLYQLMRNRVLADELVYQKGAAWADFAVCFHADNQKVLALPEPVSSTSNVFEAFRFLSSPDAVLDWNAEKVLGVIRSNDDRLGDWERWMYDRYFDQRPRGIRAIEERSAG
jgi:hypothetical protein